MLKKILSLIYQEGLFEFIAVVFRHYFPCRVKNYQQIKALFQNRKGLEIGGPSVKFGRRGLVPVYPIAQCIDNCNFAIQTIWEGSIEQGQTFVFDKTKPPGKQYIVEATDLSGMTSGTYDFVLSSHTIEHTANPLRALIEWSRVLKEEGALILITPHKDGTFDHQRPVTKFSHLIKDFQCSTAEDDAAHFQEVFEMHDISKDPGICDLDAFKDRALDNYNNRCIHHHVFDTQLVIDMANYIGLEILHVGAYKPFDILLIAKKLPSGQIADNTGYQNNSVAIRWESPFPTDQN